MTLSCLPCVLLASSSSSFVCVEHDLHNGFPTFLWKRTTPVIVGWFADRTWENENKWWYTELPKLLFNFYNIYTIYKCGRGPHNITWRAAGWRHDVHPPVASSWIKIIFLAPRSLTLNVCFSLEVGATFHNAKIFLGESPLASCHQQGARPPYIPYSA